MYDYEHRLTFSVVNGKRRPKNVRWAVVGTKYDDLLQRIGILFADRFQIEILQGFPEIFRDCL